MANPAALAADPSVADHTVLREVVETLAPLDKRAGSPGERDAAHWIAERLDRAGAAARVEEVPFLDGYAKQLLPLALLSAAAGSRMAATGRGRRLAAGVGALATAAIVDDSSNGPRLWRRAVAPSKTTWNVLAGAGDPGAGRTLVVLAHHDAAPTGIVFDQSGQRWLAETFPDVVDRIDTSLPLWWPVVAGPLLVALAGATGRRRWSAAGVAACLLTAAIGADVARSPIVPGANDNLSAVAVLVALAERLREAPIAGLRVLLVSCGAEEVLQGGIYGFAERHFPSLPRDRTWVFNLDTVGSPELVMIEGEGPFVMEDYADPDFRDLVARAAAGAGLPIRRGLRSRSSTDSVIPSRAGYPTATLTSINEFKALSNYHQMSDTPENLNYETVARAAAVTEAVARELAS
jgi:hypothetical protein